MGLREGREEIAGIIGEVPEDWTVTNYKPVSLIPVVVRLLKRVLQDGICQSVIVRMALSMTSHALPTD